MAKNKKYAKDDIIDAIGEKYGSIENYAKEKGTTKQNISQKAMYQSHAFMKQLRDDGVLSIIDNSYTAGRDAKRYDHSTVTENGTPPDVVMQLVKSLQDQVKFLQSSLDERNYVIKEARETLIMKEALMNTMIEVAEETKKAVIKRFDELDEFIRQHEKKCETLHKVTHNKIKRGKK